MILSYQFSGSAGMASSPVFRGIVFSQIVKLPEGGQPRDNLLPGAVRLRVYFAFSVTGTAAGTVLELFGAP
jgi:hypothetical protein